MAVPFCSGGFLIFNGAPFRLGERADGDYTETHWESDIVEASDGVYPWTGNK